MTVAGGGKQIPSATVRRPTTVAAGRMSAADASFSAAASEASDYVDEDMYFCSTDAQHAHNTHMDVDNSNTEAQHDGRKRNRKFSDEENRVLVTAIVENYDRLFGHLCMRTPSSVKRDLWKNIRESVSGCGIQVRSHDNCRKRFDDIKRKLKVKLQTINAHAAGTGGGPPALHLELTPLEEQLSSKLPSIQVEGLEGDFDIGVYDKEMQEDVTEIEEAGTPAYSMHTELVSPDNSVADFEDVQSEGSRTLRNVSQDSCDGDIQLARPTTSASVPSYSEHQQQLLSLQEAEERMLKSNEDRHRQLLCVHEKMVTQMKGVQKLIHSTVEELRKHNTYMEAIVHCLLKQNDLHSSTVVTSFLPSTYVGTLEAHDVYQQNNEPVIETEAEMPPQQAATCMSSDKIVTAGQNKSVPLAVLSAVTLVETISKETPLTSQMAESATPSSSVSCVHEQLCSSTPLCTQSEGDKTKSSECIGSLPAKLGKKKFIKKKKIICYVPRTCTRSQKKD
ncbi:uncharacterized protein LOC142494639 [Ascaphus truei]|uniref:uncharacterized protein LOC142494639 n=1 Tax=Ascaphus truei TaxID=8439 RepID=UPI003F59C566